MESPPLILTLICYNFPGTQAVARVWEGSLDVARGDSGEEGENLTWRTLGFTLRMTPTNSICRVTNKAAPTPLLTAAPLTSQTTAEIDSPAHDKPVYRVCTSLTRVELTI